MTFERRCKTTNSIGFGVGVEGEAKKEMIDKSKRALGGRMGFGFRVKGSGSGFRAQGLRSSV